MSLINQMLLDLEARQPTLLRASDRALDGLVPATIGALRPKRLMHVLIMSALVAGSVAWWNYQNSTSRQISSPPHGSPPLALRLPTMPLPMVDAPIVSVTPLVQPVPAISVPELPIPTQPPHTSTPDATDELRAVARAIEAMPERADAAPVTPEVASAASAIETPGTFRREPVNALVAKVDVEYQRAINLLKAGRLDRGASALKAYLIEHPDAPEARITYAQTLIKLGRHQDAAQTLRGALARAPRRAEFARLLGHLLYDQGDLTEAVHVLRAAAPSVRNDVDYHAFMAALYQRLGRHQAAARIYREIVAVQPQHGNAWIGIGISLTALRDISGALAAFKRATADRTLSKAMRDYATAEITRLAPSIR